ncbi:ATP-binding protein [Corynebacterium sp. H113]|uniref:ATP-binding protein n=1 Tax=Corynebacterium sp. H113 TaxID=3133419 RepID=UPI0030B1CF90
MNNPFRPSFGLSPLVLAGRDDLVRGFQLAFAEGIGAPLRVSLLSGPRGTGKTVMLNEIEDIARSQGWLVLRASPRPGMIDNLVDPTIKDALESLDSQPAPPSRRVTGARVAGVSLSTEIVEKQESRKTLTTELRKLAEAVRTHGAGVLITLDEVQSAKLEELADLATAIQDLIRDEYDIALAAAGLPEGINALLQHEGTTFLRRAEHIELGAVSDDDVARTFSDTITSAGREVTDDAVADATRIIRGYPYLIQVVGSLSWAAATLDSNNVIGLQHVKSIESDVEQRMGSHVHQPALRPLSESQMDFLYAMARVAEDGTAQISDIADELDTTTTALSMRRRALLDAGVIVSPRRGELAFTLPFLREYLLRTDAS